MKSMMTVLLGLMMSLYACQGNTENSASEEIQDPTTKAREEIKALEAVLFEENSEELDTSLAEKTILAYKNYVRMFPRDEHAPEYLFKAGDLTRGLGDLWGATKLFNMVSKINNVLSPLITNDNVSTIFNTNRFTHIKPIGLFNFLFQFNNAS